MNQDLPNPLEGAAATTPDRPSPNSSAPSLLAPLPSQPPPIPDYELLRRIGSGSYGDVWLARNVLGQCRAVKVIYRNRFSDPRPFEREFEGIQSFEPISRSHPSQLSILHVGKNDAAGCFYYVMELADCVEAEGEKRGKRERENEAPPRDDGRRTHSSVAPAHFPPFSPATYSPKTLRSLLSPAHFPTGSPARPQRLPIPDCVQIGLSLATALAHLHEQGLVHRDIKPSNIIFVNGVAKLGDIGLVTEAGDTQSIVGTEGYLPPEGPGTPQADLFSLGKVLYEMSTGMDRRRFAELPDDLREWPDRDAVFEFNSIVLRACAKDPGQRYETAEQLRADLALLREGKSVLHARRNQRLRSQVTKVVLALVLLTLVIAGLGRLARNPKPNEAAGDGPPSTNELANALCAKGLLIIRGDNYLSFAEAYTHFHRAMQLDPNFARPYVGLFELRPWEEVPGLPPPSHDEMRGIARGLTELAPKLAVTYCAQAYVAWCELNYVKAKEYALQAVQADPDYAHGHATYGFMLALWGWPIEARTEIEMARRLAPSKVYIYRLLAHTYFVERDFPKAIASYREALTWEPHHLRAYDCLALASLAMGDPMTAISYHEQIPIIRGTHDADSKAWYAELRQAVAEQGAIGYWRKREEKYSNDPDGNFYEQAVCQMHLGNPNAALALLNRSFETHEKSGGSSTPRIYVLLFDEVWDGVRDDPRFRALLNEIGFTKVMPIQP